jgi:cytosine/adenosine deaminase-related metal-dependent hydrolase
MILNNLKTALTGDPVSIKVEGGTITDVSLSPYNAVTGQLNITFKNAIVFPGIINSHDHLDFNLFPSLGDRTYSNYTEWGRYIHSHYKDKIDRVLQIPVALREQWGVYKNLINGVTTVINHGKKIKKHAAPITVYEHCQCIHSVQFEKKWWLSLNNPLKKNLPVAIHTGEGIDKRSAEEIDWLIKRNLLKRSIIGVHGVAMKESQAPAFKALVWCPESNHFLLNKSAPVNQIKKHIPILFGTDSTLTGSWNLWEHIRRGRATKLLTDAELFDTLTINPAKTWGLNCGEISAGKDADIVVAKEKKVAPAKESFFNLDPQDILLVIHKGHIALFDEDMYPQLKNEDVDSYSRIYIGGSCKYVSGNLPTLMRTIERYYGGVDFPVI